MSDSDTADDRHKAKSVTGSAEGGTDTMPSEGAGEDEGSAPVDGDDGHLKDDQKPATR